MDKIIEFVQKELYNDNTGHDFNHIKRVVSNAYKILKEEGGNELIIITACYLHDVIDEKLFKNIDEQIKKINKLLKELNYTENDITEILDIISSISYSKHKKLTSLNAMIVQDADRLDSIGAIGIIRTIEYGNSLNRKFYEEENLLYENDTYSFNKSTKTTLSHFYDKLLKLYELMNTTTGKELARKRSKFLEQFLKEFYEEL